jgi:hypothetical protein
MKVAKRPIPATGKKAPPKSSELEASNCALDAKLLTASTASTGIILADVVRANAGAETVRDKIKARIRM